MRDTVLLDPSLKHNPPSLWTVHTSEGRNSWRRFKSWLDYDDLVPTASNDTVWRSLEHKHLSNGMTRFFYMNDNFPNESYTYDAKMSLCPFCNV